MQRRRGKGTLQSRPSPRRHQQGLYTGEVNPPRASEHAAPVVGSAAARSGAGRDLRADGRRSVELPRSIPGGEGPRRDCACWRTQLNTNRTVFDPEDRYPAEGHRLVERNAERVMALMPGGSIERTRDSIQIDTGGERGLVILVTPEAIELRLPTVEWTGGSHGPATSSRLWRRLKLEKLSDESLSELLQKAFAARAAEFKKCRYCGEFFPPEHRTGRACHGCASDQEGIVY